MILITFTLYSLIVASSIDLVKCCVWTMLLWFQVVWLGRELLLWYESDGVWCFHPRLHTAVSVHHTWLQNYHQWSQETRPTFQWRCSGKLFSCWLWNGEKWIRLLISLLLECNKHPKTFCTFILFSEAGETLYVLYNNILSSIRYKLLCKT